MSDITANTTTKITSNDPWYVLGAGAMGCLWAAYLTLAGFPVILITRTQRHGAAITLSKNNQSEAVAIQKITISELNQSSINIKHLLVTTKAQQTLDALTDIQSHIDTDATLLILQNGMASKEIATLLTTQQLIKGITTDGAYRSDELSVVHAGVGETLIGDGCIINCLPEQYLTIKHCDDIDNKQWQKLAINCAINGLTVIYQCRNGELLNNPEAMARIKTLCDEITTVMQALNIPLENSDRLFEQTVHTLTITADNYSSMYQDSQQQQTTEIDYINGYLCNEAKRLNISCPENQRVLAAIKTIEQSYAQ
jgi:2-dehydropantoate 2-reductase